MAAPTGVATAAVSEWQPPDTAPLGKKVQLLTENEVAVIGTWQPAGYLAWAPFPKKPQWLRDRIDRMRNERKGR